MLSEIVYKLRIPVGSLKGRDAGDIRQALLDDLPQGPWRIRSKPFVQPPDPDKERPRDDWRYSVCLPAVPPGDWREDDMPSGPTTAALALELWSGVSRGIRLDIPWRTVPGAQEQDGFRALRVPAYLLVSNGNQLSRPDARRVLERVKALSDALASADFCPVLDDNDDGLWLGVADLANGGSPLSSDVFIRRCLGAWCRAEREPSQPRAERQEKAGDTPR